MHGTVCLGTNSSLRKSSQHDKIRTDTQIVYIAENGRGEYIFTSEEVLEREIRQAVERALYEERLRTALTQSRTDLAEGRYYSSRDKLRAAVEEKRASHGWARVL